MRIIRHREVENAFLSLRRNRAELRCGVICACGLQGFHVRTDTGLSLLVAIDRLMEKAGYRPMKDSLMEQSQQNK
jgi:hypothetical protein